MMIYEGAGQKIDFWGEKDLPTNPKRIGINMSSGTDSTLVAVLTAEHFKHDGVTIIPHTHDDLNRASAYTPVTKIVEILVDRYPTVHFDTPQLFPHRKDINNPRSKIPNEDIVIPLREDIVLAGRTLDAPFEAVAEYSSGEGRFKESQKPLVQDIGDTGVKVYRPLAQVDKKFVAAMYDKFDMMYDIYPLTCSCINLFHDHVHPCKQCYWCGEKKWAFGTYDFNEV